MRRREIGTWLLAGVALAILAAAIAWRLWTPIHGARRIPAAADAAVAGWPHSLTALLHVWAGALGACAWARVAALPWGAAALAGVGVTFGLAAGDVLFTPALRGLAWLPWLAAAMTAVARRPTPTRAALVAVPTAFAYLGDPALALVGGALVAGAVASGVRREDRPGGAARAARAATVVLATIGLALIAATLLRARGPAGPLPPAGPLHGLFLPRLSASVPALGGVTILLAGVALVRREGRGLVLGALAALGVALLAGGRTSAGPLAITPRVALAVADLLVTLAAAGGLAILTGRTVGRPDGGSPDEDHAAADARRRLTRGLLLAGLLGATVAGGIFAARVGPPPRPARGPAPPPDPYRQALPLAAAGLIAATWVTTRLAGAPARARVLLVAGCVAILASDRWLAAHPGLERALVRPPPARPAARTAARTPPHRRVTAVSGLTPGRGGPMLRVALRRRLAPDPAHG